jgi:hydroxymethylbilane synthase
LSALIIATRASELALRQAGQVQTALASRGVESALKTYTTVGDRNLDQPLSAIGAKGLFTQELERDLAEGRVHCCVHSLKDLPTEMPRGLELVAMLEREDPRDALVVNAEIDAHSIGDLPPRARVGTSSLRRRAQLHALRPDLEIVDLRGNVPTRVRKIADRVVDAAILAAAGLHRLDLASHIAAYLDAPAWLAAAGQGAIAVQIRGDDHATRALLAPVAHHRTMIDASAERAFLAALEGGCQVPIGASVLREGSSARLYGFISDLTGTTALRGDLPLDARNPGITGAQLAGILLDRGARQILMSLRNASAMPPPQPE